MKRINKSKLLVTDDLAPEPERSRRSKTVECVAVDLANRLGLSIDLVHVDDPYLYQAKANPLYRPLLQRYFNDQRAKLTQRSKKMDALVRSIFLIGSPARKLLSLSSRKSKYECLIMGTHGRKGLSRLILGSVAEEVIRNANIPVMTIGPMAQGHLSGLTKHPKLRILVPTTLTPNSVRAERYAITLAKRLGADVILLHSLNGTLHPALQMAFVDPGTVRQFDKELQKIISYSKKRLKFRARTLSKSGVEVTPIFAERNFSTPVSILNEITKSNVSLVVMGTHGRSMISGAFFGRTAREVILEATVPVITIRSRGQ